MADLILPQIEADALIAMEKHVVDENPLDFPMAGGKVTVPLVSPNKKESFILDINRGRIDLLKATYQNRARNVLVLVRLDISGPPHMNPDGEEIGCPHIHRYREGYGHKWAFPIPTDIFKYSSDLWQTFEDFMAYCSITRPPVFQRNLFT